MALVYFIIGRLREPSSWAAITAMLAGFGVTLSPEVGTAVVSAGIGLAGLIAVLVPEKKA